MPDSMGRRLVNDLLSQGYDEPWRVRDRHDPLVIRRAASRASALRGVAIHKLLVLDWLDSDWIHRDRPLHTNVIHKRRRLSPPPNLANSFNNRSKSLCDVPF